MTRKVYVSAAGKARQLDVDKQTIVNRYKRSQLEAAAFLKRSGKFIPLFEAGKLEVPATLEAETCVVS